MTDFAAKTDPNTGTQGDPIAFFITWPTYGTWLPGDERGWVDLHHGWQLSRPLLELECKSKMTEDACRLDVSQRELGEQHVHETCRFRGWQVHAVNCRSNHLHIVIGAHDIYPKNIRADIKAWCTRRLKEKVDPNRENWWAQRGSIRWIWNEGSLATVIDYVNEARDMKHDDITTRRVSEGPAQAPSVPRSRVGLGNGGERNG